MVNAHTPSAWLVTIMVYNNALYDTGRMTGEPEHVGMDRQTAYLLQDVEDSLFSEQIKIVVVESRIGLSDTGSGLDQSIFIHEKVAGGLVEWPASWPAILPDLSKEDGFATLFGTVVAAFPARRHMLITVGHGSVLGINYQPVVDIPAAERESGAVLLTNAGLASAITSVFGAMPGGKKLDVLVMFNCLMQTLFTQFELRHAVDWLVAPITGIGHPGYQYRMVFGELARLPGMDTVTAARLFLDTAGESRADVEPCYQQALQASWKLHAVQLEAVLLDNVYAEWTRLLQLVEQMDQRERDTLYSLKLARRQVYNYAQHCLPGVKIIDLAVLLWYWKRVLNDYAALQLLVPRIDALLMALQPVSSFSFTGSDLYRTAFYFVDEDIPAEIRTGFGLWLPHKAPGASRDLFSEVLKAGDTEIVPAFIKNTPYREVFLRFTARFG